MTEHKALVVDVSPLWELQYTGIANVVYEVTKRLLEESRFSEVIFTVFHYIVDVSLIRESVASKNGGILRPLFEDVSQLRRPWELISECESASALYLHVRPTERHYGAEGQLYYDFSFLGMPEAHHPDTVEYHSKDLVRQINGNDHIFVISHAVARDLEFYFSFPTECTHVVPLGVHLDDATAIAFGDAVAGRGCEPYFACVGTIEPRKNVRIILAWLSNHREVLDTYRFVFAGRDAWGEGFQELIASYSLEQEVLTRRIVHLGYVSDRQKTALMMGAVGVIYPSLFEGFGLPVLEAMGLEVPVVASCSSSIPEVLGPEGNYFDPYDLSSFDSAMRRAMSEHGSAEARHKLQRMKARLDYFNYDRCYEELIRPFL